MADGTRGKIDYIYPRINANEHEYKKRTENDIREFPLIIGNIVL
jgi:hypothetical protein